VDNQINVYKNVIYCIARFEEMVSGMALNEVIIREGVKPSYTQILHH